ncbi:ubiquitin-related modifier 1 homolog 1 [Tanacetum coccineum]
MATFEVLDELMEITGLTELHKRMRFWFVQEIVEEEGLLKFLRNRCDDLRRKNSKRRVLIRRNEALGESGVAVDSLEGGLELLCNSVKIHSVDVDLPAEEKKLTMKHLLAWVKSNLIKERPEMFMKGDSVRPGVLVLVNDCDWELSGQLDTTLENKDVVVFISTLHGG